MKFCNNLFKRMLAFVSAFALVCFGINFSIKPEKASAQEDTAALVKEMELLVNEARAELGLNPLYVSPYLCELSELRTQECAVLWSSKHLRPDGSKFSTIIDTSVTPYWYVAENIGAGTPEPDVMFEQWRNSSKHWGAITNPNTTHMGIAVSYVEGSDYEWYWEQLFIQSAKTESLENQFMPQRYEVIPTSCGDINGDGFVDTFDYILLMKYLDNEAYLNDLQLESADCLKDGSITIADAATLQKYILGKIAQLPDSLF